MGSSFSRNELIIVSACIIIAFLIFLAALALSPLDTKEIEARFSANNDMILGVDVNGSGLSFGNIPPGISVSRNIVINNERDFPVRVKILVEKKIVDYVYTPEAEYFLESGQSISVPFVLNLPNSIPSGNYTGKVKFETFRENFIGKT